MDLFEILIVLLFIVFPILQQVLGRRGGEEKEPGETPLEERSARREQHPPIDSGPGPAEEEGWSAGWGTWAEEAPELEEAQPEPVAPIELAPEVERVSAPVVSLESLRVDRAAEHARIHEIHARPPARPFTGRPRLASLLSSRRDVRRGIVLAEVLGPPAALREPPNF